MGNIFHSDKPKGRRTYIHVHVTAKSRKAKALLKRFRRQVRALQNEWERTVGRKKGRK